MYFGLVLLICLINSSEGIKVFTSKLKLTEYGDAISGAKLVDNRTTKGLAELTFCIRFNYKLLSTKDQGISTLVTISSWREGGQDPEWELLYFWANYPFTFIGFGTPRKPGSFILSAYAPNLMVKYP